MDAINRFTFLKKDVDFVKKNLNNKEKGNIKFPKWFDRMKSLGDFSVKDGKLIFDGRELIAEEDIDDRLRSVYFSTNDRVKPVLLGRDSTYNLLKSKFIGISRRRLAIWLSRQPFREIDVAPKEVKNPGERIKGFGYLELDLVEVKKKDLPEDIQEQYEKDFYLIGMVDRLSGYVWYKIAKSKTQEEISPLLKKGIEFFNKTLPTKVKQISKDAGGEFDTQLIIDAGIKSKNVRLGSLIENKNGLFQRYLYKFLKARSGKLSDVVEKTANSLNSIKSRITGFMPKEAVKMEANELLEKYNEKRAKGGKHSKPLKVGTLVRVAYRKGKGAAAAFSKSYRTGRWSDGWKIITVSGYRYKVKKKNVTKWVTRNNIRVDHGIDKISKKLIEERTSLGDKVKDPVEQAQGKQKKPKSPPKPNLRRSSRRSARVAKQKIFQTSASLKLPQQNYRESLGPLIDLNKMSDIVSKKPGRYRVRNEIIHKTGKNKYRANNEKHFFQINVKNGRARRSYIKH